MATFVTSYFDADNVEDALNQVLTSPAIPKNVQKISTDIINNFPEQRYRNGVAWDLSNGDVLECYKESSNGYEFGLNSKKLSRDILMVCYGRIDQSDAVPPFPSKYSDPESKIFEYEQAIKGKITERGALFDADGNILCYASGDNHSTNLPYGGNDAVYLTHSHPDLAFSYSNGDERFEKIHFGTAFSMADFNLFLKHRNLKQLRVVFSNGVVMVCEKTKPKLTRADINLALKALSRNSENRTEKTYKDYILHKGIDSGDDDVELNRKLVKYSYETDKSTAANLGLHIFFILKDGRMVEHLKGKRTSTPKKKSVKRTVKKIGDNFNDLIF